MAVRAERVDEGIGHPVVVLDQQHAHGGTHYDRSIAESLLVSRIRT